MAHRLNNRLAVIQSVTQRLKRRLTGPAMDWFAADLDVLESALKGCIEDVRGIEGGGKGAESDDRPRPCGPHGADGPRDSRAPAGRRLLYVENDVQVRRYIGFVLEQAGWSVTAAADAVGALDALGRERFDVVLTDLFLGSGSVLELVDGVEALPVAVPIGLLSGWDVPEEIEDRFAFVLHKPVSDEVLLDALAEAVGSAERAQ